MSEAWRSAGALHARDRKDAAVNPFVPPSDAVVLDTGDLDVNATVSGARGDRGAGAGAAAVTVPRIAVIGRQNVGKSTLVNRLFGRRGDHPRRPGITRDRVELEATWNGRRFGLVDTAGYLRRASGVGAGCRAVRTRDRGRALVLLVVDVTAGVVDEDAVLARRLRRLPVPAVVVANKVDSAEDESDATAFHALGLGDPIAVSAKHGRGSGSCSTGGRAAPRCPRGRMRTPASLDSRWWASRTSASPACSTGSWGRSAPWCSKRPAPPATASTR